LASGLTGYPAFSQISTVSGASLFAKSTECNLLYK
jgi:hypothetical protein